MKKQIERVINMSLISNPNVVFYSFLIVFAVDNIVNMFVDIPVFVPFAIIMLPLIWSIIWFNHPKKLFLIIYSLVFIATALVSNILFGFGRKNISDLTFILMLVASYYFYQLNIQRNAIYTVQAFFIVCVLMFSVTFLNIDSSSWYKNDQPLKKEIHQYKVDDQQPVVKKMPVLKHVSYLRKYHNGFFRVPHVATYFFGFLTLFFAYFFFTRKKIYYLLVGILSLLFMFYTGGRTFLVAVAIGFLIFLFRKRTLVYALLLVVIAGLAVIFRYELFILLKDTFLGSYSFLLVNTVDNWEGITRVVMLKSLWTELKCFSFVSLITGKTFLHSIAFNDTMHHITSWLHNDFSSITYSYGLAGLVLYVLFYVVVFIENRRIIRGNIFIFLFYVTMVVAAFINGFYYFFPIFLIYIFIVMVNEERKLQIN